MNQLDPNKIYADYIHDIIDRSSALNKLIVLIENSDNIQIRITSIELLVKIGGDFENINLTKEKLFALFENLMISDSNKEIRKNAAVILGNKFFKESLNPMRWAFHHEQSPDCLPVIYETLIKIVKRLGKTSDRFSKFLLIHELKQIHDKDFKIGFESISEKIGVNQITNKELSLILINYLTITYLKKTVWRLKHTIENCRVVEIDFQFKGLTTIPNNIQYFESLRRLILRYNQISRIPKWISKLTYLETLNLNVNSIKEIPESVGVLFNLKELLLWKNEIKLLPDSICNLKSLELLNLRLNHLKVLPSKIGNLSNLRELNLHDNKLSQLPSSISKIILLEKLNLSWNSLRTIPDSINLLSNLRVLDLERNQLTNLPKTIGKLVSLEILNISDNNLSKIPDTIGLLKTLKTLNLSRNNIEYLPHSINSLTSLRELNLVDNKLKEMPNELKTLEDKGLVIYY